MTLNFSKDEFLDLLHFNICSCYAFNIEQLELFKEMLDWTQISSNQMIDWNYELIKQFENYIDWKFLKKNRKVNSNVTLGLLFPERAELPKCHCSFNYEICECSNRNWHNGNWERGLLRADYFLPSNNPEFDWIMEQIVNSINEEMLADLLLKDYIDDNLLIHNNIVLKS